MSEANAKLKRLYDARTASPISPIRERPTWRCRDQLSKPDAMASSSETVGALNSAQIHGTHVPGGGAVHSVKSRLTRSGARALI